MTLSKGRMSPEEVIKTTRKDSQFIKKKQKKNNLTN